METFRENRAGEVDEDFLEYTCIRQRIGKELYDREILRDAAKICAKAYGMDREDLRDFDLKSFLQDLSGARVRRDGKTTYRLKKIGGYSQYHRMWRYVR